MVALLIKYSRHRVLAGCLAACLLVVAADVIAQPDKEINRWLQWLGVEAAIEQVDRTIEQEVQQLAMQHTMDAESSSRLRQQLLMHSSSQAIAGYVQSYVSKHILISGDTVTAILQSPLAVRVRNFDVALEMTGAFEKYTAFNNKRLRDPPSEKRLALMRQLDKVLRTSQIAALLQTQLNITAQQLAAKTVANQSNIKDSGNRDIGGELQWVPAQKRQREQYLSDVAVQLHLFSYRFMQDKEIQEYVDLMNNRDVQLLLDVVVQALDESLVVSRKKALE